MALKANTGADGRVVFLVEADDTKLDSQLKKTTQKIKTESKNWGSAAKNYMGKELDSLIAKVANLGEALGKFVVDFIVQGIGLAENLKEMDGLVETTFGASGQQKIDKWAKSAQTQFGITEMKAKQFAATMGTVAKSQGATTDQAEEMAEALAGLAVDFGAAYQMDSETALKKLQTALGGSASGLKGFVDMSAKAMKEYAQSLGYKDYASLSRENQLQVRYQRIMDWANQGPEPITGSFARSRGSIQNSQSRAQAGVQNVQTEVGKVFLPFKERFYNEVADLVDWLTGAPPAVEGSLENLQQWAGQIKEAADERRKELEKVAEEQGARFGIESDEYDPALWGSFGEYLYQTLLGRQMFSGGKEREKIDSALETLAPYITDIDAAEEKIAEYQKQIDYLLSISPEGAQQSGEAVAGAIAAGISSQQPAVKASVDDILREVNRLNGIGFGGVRVVRPNGIYTPLATGLDYVPYDNYRAALHEGESVLTAQEAKVWRAMKFNLGNQSNLNYDALGGVMRENVRAGGNVYLDGQSVGRVISARQADSYRAMERSGFQQ